MEEVILDLRSISLKSKKDLNKLRHFLHERDLDLDTDIDYAIVLEEDDKIIASGAMSGPVLKCIAVSKSFEGEGLIGKIVTYLLLNAHHHGVNHLFLYTNPKNIQIFTELGFHEIIRVDETAVLMENRNHGLPDYLKKLSESKVPGNEIASIVMNCNPFTNGHRYLIEQAASENDHVHVFILDENLSQFPTDVRIRLVEEGTADLKNVTIHHSGNYIISAATFPSYFLKESKKIIDAHGRLDLQLFCRFIAPALGITSRYAGEEPYCVVTSRYNELMEEILPSSGIKLYIIKRKENGKDVISASMVRELLKIDDFKKIKKIVPPATFKYLESKEAEPIIRKIKG